MKDQDWQGEGGTRGKGGRSGKGRTRLRHPRGSTWDWTGDAEIGQVGEVTSFCQADGVKMERVKRAGKWDCSLYLLDPVSPPRPGRKPRVSDRSQRSGARQSCSAPRQPPRLLLTSPCCHNCASTPASHLCHPWEP